MCVRAFSLEKGIIVGLVPILLGALILASAVFAWKATDWGMLDTDQNLRTVISAATCVCVGTQIVFTSFILSLLDLKTDREA